MPSNVMYKEKKFMWDGIDYPSKEKALERRKGNGKKIKSH
jgi:hypothetical protein